MYFPLAYCGVKIMGVMIFREVGLMNQEERGPREEEEEHRPKYARMSLRMHSGAPINIFEGWIQCFITP